MGIIPSAILCRMIILAMLWVMLPLNSTLLSFKGRKVKVWALSVLPSPISRLQLCLIVNGVTWQSVLTVAIFIKVVIVWPIAEFFGRGVMVSSLQRRERYTLVIQRMAGETSALDRRPSILIREANILGERPWTRRILGMSNS